MASESKEADVSSGFPDEMGVSKKKHDFTPEIDELVPSLMEDARVSTGAVEAKRAMNT